MDEESGRRRRRRRWWCLLYMEGRMGFADTVFNCVGLATVLCVLLSLSFVGRNLLLYP